MTALDQFRDALKTGEHMFADTLTFVSEHYHYTPAAFRNGDVDNNAGQNEGSCKTLGLALLEQFSDQEALLAFGEHYRAVRDTPDGFDHANIRSLQKHGLVAVSFEQLPLVRR